MKHAFLTFLFLISLSSKAQEDINSTNLNDEIKLNVLTTVLGAPEISYEHSFSNNSSFGTSVLINFNSGGSLRFALTPFYRKYFGKNKNSTGFFIEGFSMFNTMKAENTIIKFNNYVYTTEKKEETFNSIALGGSIGVKWKTQKNLTIEINGGTGYNLLSKSTLQNTQIVPRIGVSLGYRM